MSQKIRKVVIPAAGFGTRFLPATKALPKEMFPIIDKPVIQYVVEEAAFAGIEDVIIVTGWNKRAIEDHFDYPFELVKKLEEAGKVKELEEVKKSASLANFIYIRQKGPTGNATPILNAKNIIGDEPFLVLWGDDFIVAEPSRSKQLIDAYEKYGCSIVCGIRTSNKEDTKKYAYAAGREIEDGVIEVTDLIEKPGPENAPSNLAVVSGFIFTPDIFEEIDLMIKEGATGVGGEYVYADALRRMIKKGKRVIALEVKDARYYDTGNKLEFLKTTVEFGLKHPELNGELKEWLKGLKLD
jgi:UTP--glucose-1-phosphate uridylyltransferase